MPTRHVPEPQHAETAGSRDGAARAAARPAVAQPSAAVAALAARPPAARAAAIRALSASAGNSAVARWLARQPKTAAPPGTGAGLDAADHTVLNDEMERHNEIADVESAQEALDGAESDDEAEFWREVLEDAKIRAFHFRCALILGEAEPTTHDELYKLLESVEEDAGDEAKTLGLVGQEFAEQDAWAFPATWASRVNTTLQPPAGLDVSSTVSAESAAVDKLSQIAERIPGYVYAHGLPVPFGAAIGLKSFRFSDAQATKATDHVVRQYVDQTRDVITTKVRADLARGWERGKQSLVSAVEQGEAVVDVASWATASAPRHSAQDLPSMIGAARSADVSIWWDLALDDAVDVWRYELALAKVAGYRLPFAEIDAATFVISVFAMAMLGADTLVQKADGDERMRRADAWADEHGYPAAARALIFKALRDNIDEIALDLAMDVGISMIPGVGWIWAAKEFVEEVSDLYDAADNLIEARKKVFSALSVVDLQRAAAELSLAEFAAELQVALTLISDLKLKAKADVDVDVHNPDVDVHAHPDAGGGHGGAPPPPAPPAPPAAPPAGGDPPKPTRPATTTPPAPDVKKPDTPPAKTDTPAKTDKPAKPPAKADVPAAPDRSKVIDDLLKEGEAAGVDLKRSVLEDLAKTDPKQFDVMVGKVREELAARRKHLGDKGSQTAGEFEDAGKKGEPETTRKPKDLVDATRKGKVKRSHDDGVQFGKEAAAKDKIKFDDWNNAEAYEGDYGHGFDDVGRKGGDRLILEYKGESSKLSPKQMTSAWVGNVLARLKVLEDPIADELLKAAKAGSSRASCTRPRSTWTASRSPSGRTSCSTGTR